MKKVVLVIGNRYQANACGFIKEFESGGGKIDEILCLQPLKNWKYHLKKPFSILKKLKPSNVFTAFRSFAAFLTNKQTLQVLKSRWNYEGENSWDLLNEHFDIFSHAADKGIPLSLSPFLSASVVKKYTKDGPVIFPMYTGGLLSKSVLEAGNAEFLNAHMGEMPVYRGMNVLEWAVLEDKQPKVAVMVMNEKIDGGDVIWHKEIILSTEKNISELRKTGYVHCYKAMAEGILNYLKNPGLRQAQPKGSRYYYRMHEQLRMQLENRLKVKHGS